MEMTSFLLRVVVVASVLFFAGAAMAKDHIRVTCVGDSITFGVGTQYPEKESYPSQLAKLLGEKYQVVNFGSHGATMLKKGDLSYWRPLLLSGALDTKPNIVIIMLGTNDSKPQNWKFKDQYVSDYIEMIKGFQKLKSNPKVYICYPIPAFPGRVGISDKVIKKEIIPKIDKVAKKTKVQIIDLYKPLRKKSALFPDLVHPNVDGAKIIADVVFKAVAGK